MSNEQPDEGGVGGFDPDDLAELSETMSVVAADWMDHDTQPVLAAAIFTTESAIDYCNLVCYGGNEAIPRMLEIASAIGVVCHKILMARGLDPHTGEPLDSEDLL